MASENSAAYRPLDLPGCQALAGALGDTPSTVIYNHVLARRLCKAYVAGDPSRFHGAIVQADAFPTEPTGFGSDLRILWDLLQAVEGWDCILVDSACAAPLGRTIETEMGVPVRYLDDVCTVLTHSPATFRDQAVRLLTLADLDLLQAAPHDFRASCWAGTRDLLAEGIVACAIVSGRIVATALTAARSARHAEIGVFTHEDFRLHGFATAAASLVAHRAQQAGQIPVWSAGSHNAASLHVAQKLGFVEVSRRTYVILDRGLR